MAIVNSKKISWDAAPDADIVKHWVFAVPEGQTIDPKSTPHVEITMPTTEIVAPDDFPAGTFSGDSNYTIGLVAVDDVGNMSDLVTVSAPFDFIAPGAPSNIIVTDI